MQIQSKMMQYTNQWFHSLQKVFKISNIGIPNWTNMAYSLLKGWLNVFSNLFSLLVFPSGLFSVGSSSKLKLEEKYDSKESHCIIVLCKNFPTFNHFVETCFSNFIIVKVYDSRVIARLYGTIKSIFY